MAASSVCVSVLPRRGRGAAFLGSFTTISILPHSRLYVFGQLRALTSDSFDAIPRSRQSETARVSQWMCQLRRRRRCLSCVHSRARFSGCVLTLPEFAHLAGASDGSRPRKRDDAARHNEMMSPTVTE